MAKISKARQRANHKWNEKNKDKQRIYQYRSNAKKFILEMADEKDLDKFSSYIQARRIELNND
ncbi:hypothetical protein [Limosilactobacillus reuteri]|uniref:hypothetical protein n=1 Tax=Limosilactobacillus reuteri TaxID=1598 RepID=UPI000A1EE7E3|nr:hypothetical protein [Limosilactobacillus reuteri]MQB90610.1 hypothetical protein [Limosilactobacillus reuteri]